MAALETKRQCMWWFGRTSLPIHTILTV